MVRALWSGSISFGLVNVPIKLVSAVQAKDVRFNQLHGKDGGRVQYKKVCSLDGEEVQADEIVKGYEISPERYVTLSEDELDALDPVSTRMIDILDFCDLDEIDPIYFEKPYYLVPNKGAGKAYGLLTESMRRSNRIAIARMVMHNKEHLVALRVIEDVLSMTTLFYHDEVVPAGSLEVEEPAAAPSEKEIAMAEQLISSLVGPFDPTKYHDEHRKRVLDLIERKAEGQEIVVQAAPKQEARPVDLVTALQASLEAAKKRRAAEG